jgi:hypothetical protein
LQAKSDVTKPSAASILLCDAKQREEAELLKYFLRLIQGLFLQQLTLVSGRSKKVLTLPTRPHHFTLSLILSRRDFRFYASNKN